MGRAFSSLRFGRDFGRWATLWNQRGEVEAAANLLTHLHEDEAELVAAIAGTT